jgi:predicted Zn-dependent protease
MLAEKSSATDVTNRNDFACTSLLLGINLAQAHQIARELHADYPADVVLASTYAYSLCVQGKTSEGLVVLSRFSDQELQQPQIALYYGVLLAKTGRLREARSYLASAEKVSWSPEEKQLLDEAIKTLRRTEESTQRRRGAETQRNETTADPSASASLQVL